MGCGLLLAPCGCPESLQSPVVMFFFSDLSVVFAILASSTAGMRIAASELALELHVVAIANMMMMMMMPVTHLG